MSYTPGNLVHARGRDWVVQSGSTDTYLWLRPLTGGSDELSYIMPELESDPVTDAEFPLPDPEQAGNLGDSALFRNSVMLRLRDGAGPIRCLGHIAVEPRSYQLTPLLMAMKMDTVRILISDDVGIGKTIEAGLIVREMMDRFEIERLSVLCPPHLVDQWVVELREHFNLDAVGVTSSSVYALEKVVPAGMSITEYYPVTVVSLDYIKNPNKRDNFIHTAPECIIVDEAHTCTEKSGNDSQLRFQLLQELAKDTSRHMLFLTATPHSGDNVAFGKLLSLLDPKYEVLGGTEPESYKELRKELGLHLVQRQRKDLDEFTDNPSFAKRLSNSYAYTFNNEWKEFFEEVREYCFKIGSRLENKTAVIWYAILALYRSVASSPESAIKALETRLSKETGEIVYDEENVESLFDKDSADSASDINVTVSDLFEDSKKLKELLESAKILRGLEDPKLELLVKILKKNILKPDDDCPEGCRPIIFCKYIATAKYVCEELRSRLSDKKYTVDVITGEMSAEERMAKVEDLSLEEFPVLVATDCLSEGINLQNTFNAVVHYDLAWNPTRHEQREGRVDRFGQNAKAVKCAMIYGQDNPVDGFILNVIIRKTKEIKDSLGIMMPIPDDGKAVQTALIKAAMLKQKLDSTGQQYFDFYDDVAVEEMIDKPWQDAAEKTKKNRAIFAQRSIHPDEVFSCLSKEKQILGSDEDVENFVIRTLQQLNVMPETKNGGYKIRVSNMTAGPVIERLRLQLEDAGIYDGMKVSFHFPAPTGFTYIHRSHPLVETLASFVFEYNMMNHDRRLWNLGARCSVTETSDVDELNVLYLLRVRMQLSTFKKGQKKTAMAEETLLLKYQNENLITIDSDDYSKYLNVIPSGNISESYRTEKLKEANDIYVSMFDKVNEVINSRAEKLLEEHRSLRDASGAKGRISVEPCLPVDVLGIYILVPSEEDF